MVRVLWLAVIGAALAWPARAAADVASPAPWLGVLYEPPGHITDVYPHSPAAVEGLRSGDEITAIGRVPLGPNTDLRMLVLGHKVGSRLPITFVRAGRVWRAAPRLVARPSDDELVYQTLIDQWLPPLAVRDRLDAEVPLAERSGRPMVWMVFDARCDRCATAAAALGERVAHTVGQAAGAASPFRVVLYGGAPEASAYLSRVPVAAPVWRIDREGEVGRLGKRIVGGLDPASNGVILVVDHGGQVRFASALSAGDAAYDGACAALSRAVVEWRRDR